MLKKTFPHKVVVFSILPSFFKIAEQAIGRHGIHFDIRARHDNYPKPPRIVFYFKTIDDANLFVLTAQSESSNIRICK